MKGPWVAIEFFSKNIFEIAVDLQLRTYIAINTFGTNQNKVIFLEKVIPNEDLHRLEVPPENQMIFRNMPHV